MITALTSILFALGAADAPQLTPQLLADHPGLRSGDYVAVRNDVLAALEADPASPWAFDAATLVNHLREYCAAPLDTARLHALCAQVTDGRASTQLRRELVQEVQSRLFSGDPYPLEGDLFDDYLGNWHALGPIGSLTESAPLYRHDADAPEARLAASYPSTLGTTLTWKPLPRMRNVFAVLPARALYPTTGGVGYLLTFVKTSAEEALLEVMDGEKFEAYWNGERVLECRRESATERTYSFFAPVRVNPGWNALLIRFPLADDVFSAARLLTLDGDRLAVEEAEWDGENLPSWSASEPSTFVAPSRPPGPFADALEVATATLSFRADEALAIGEPTDPAALPAWLRARHLALTRNPHLPGEVERRLQLEVEERLAALDVVYPEIEMIRIERLVNEDKPEEALELADALVAAHPDALTFARRRARVLLALDPTNYLARPYLLEILERFGDDDRTLLQLSQIAANAGDWEGTIDAFRRALRAGGSDSGAVDRGFSWLALDRGALAAEAEAWLAQWRHDFPAEEHIEEYQRRLRLGRGDLDAVRDFLEEDVREFPEHVDPLLALAHSPALDGREEEVAALLREVVAREPGRHVVHRTLALLGVENEAESFFREFATDVDTVRTMEVPATNASTALLLDSGMVYVHPDGATQNRTHAIEVALDRTGSERMHEQNAFPDTRVARVLDADGTIYEPVLVNDTWVWPSLDAGDAVEQVYDRYSGRTPGDIQSLGGWFFASFAQPFVHSRYVVYIPDGLPGEWRTARFEGTHEQIRWRDGTVHIFLQEYQTRFEEEQFRPSNLELLPWVHYGKDFPLEWIVADYRRYVRYLDGVAADLRGELEAVVATTSGTDRERAAALFEIVTDHVLDFSGEGDTTDVWTMRAGDPTGLLAALFRLADIEFEWAILAPPIAPELDPEPTPAFFDHSRFGVPCLRLAAEVGEEDLWVLIPAGGRGLAFGSIPEQFAGARALLVERERTPFVEVPRSGLEDTWSLDLDVTYTIDADGGAVANGSLRITGARGAFTREQISQIEPEQRSQVARNFAASTVPGLDLEAWEFADLDVRGAPLDLRFSGPVPSYVQGSGAERSCRLRLPPTNLSTSFGAAERTWPLAFRGSNRTRARIRLEFDDSWAYAFAPESHTETASGFLYDFQVTRDPQTLDISRVVELRGMYLEPDEVPPFLNRNKECEDIEEREVQLTKR